MSKAGFSSSFQLKPGEENIRGVLERIVYQNEENHYTIGELRLEKAKGGIVETITGALPGVQCGETLELCGQWVQHQSYGSQFKVREFESTLPSSLYGIRKYLGSGMVSGIGPSYAEKIVEHFGVDTLEVINNDSGRLKEVAGIGPKRITQIKASWDEQQALRDIMMFLQTYGVTLNQCLRLIKEYGSEAKNVLLEDPYRVARDINGLGFKTADKIAINLGFKNDSPKRLDAGIMHVLHELEIEGHTGYPLDLLQAHAAEVLDVSTGHISERLTALLLAKSIKHTTEAGILQMPASEYAERAIAESVNRLLNAESCLPSIKIEKALEWAQQKVGITYAPGQSDAIRLCLQNKFAILTGGPGTGKTTILRALSDILSAKKAKILYAAPTGRAAQRLSASTRKHASTLHRLLNYDGASSRFEVSDKKPLNCDVLIIDETSMLDCRLAAAALRAVPTHAHVYFVGDVNQLPSIGAGNVLSDLIHSAVIPVARLDQVFRQKGSSGIVTVAHNILAGQAGAPNQVQSLRELKPSQDIAFVEAHTPEDCLEKLINLYKVDLPALGYDSSRQVQALAPLHKGACGTKNINISLQKALNPQSLAINLGDLFFHVGDKVIQTRNNYDKNLFNGDIGRVTHINKEAASLAVDFGYGPIDFERAELVDLLPAYCISIHKSQGSEFPVVIIPLLKSHFMMLQRNLIYTGMTRGKRLVVFVGDPVAYAMAVKNQKMSERFTSLKARLSL